jgi:hypothetical protein
MRKLIVAMAISLVFVACEHDRTVQVGGDIAPQGIKTLVLPDGRGCEGTLHYTGGGYASVHYNFHCKDGRMFVGLENAEVK